MAAAMDDRVARVKELFAAADYEALRSACNPKVVRWEWGTFTRRSLEPAHFELHKWTPGELLLDRPDPPISGAVGHGLDAEGRMVVDHGLTEFAERFYETFYVHEDGGIAAYHYDYDPTKKLINVGWYEVDERGRVASSCFVYARGNYMLFTYTYDDAGRMVRMHRTGPNPPYGDMDDSRELEYERDTVMRVYWCYPDGRRVLDFERPTRSRTLAACAEQLEAELGAALDGSLEQHSSSPAAVALFYTDAGYQHRLPAEVAFVSDAELDALATRFDGDKDSIWNPAEWGNEVDLDYDPDLLELCNSVNQDIWQNERQDEATTLLQRVAAALAERHPPLIAYVTNLSMGEAAADVEVSVDRATRARLVERGLL